MDPEIGNYLSGADQLPGAPGVALRVVQLNQRDDVDVGELVEVLSRDPVLVARLLRTANSGMFGLPREVASVRQAVMVLGLRTVNLLALSFAAVAVSTGGSPEAFDYRSFWTQSIATAIGARRIAERRLPALKDEAFLAGMLADIGRLLLAERFPGKYAPVCERLAAAREPVHELEMQLLGVTHMQIGAALLESWGLPEVVSAAVGAHHQPETLRASGGEAGRLAQVLALASAIGELLGGLDLAARATEVKRLASEHFGMDWEAAEQLMAAIGEQVPGACAALEVESADPGRIAAIRSQATELMLRASLRLEQQVQTVQSQVSQLEARADQLKIEASLDALTGLHNRGFFDQALAAELERARAAGAPLALILVDLDHFKRVNDEYGHPVGDELLRAVAAAVRGEASGAIACRYGGEEFALICPADGQAKLRGRAEKIRRAIEALELATPRGPLRRSASLGACWVGGAQLGLTPKDLIAATDAELYRAKREGRNRCCVSILK
jgi:diguanylate cyclase (GGDEF)-like protein